MGWVKTRGGFMKKLIGLALVVMLAGAAIVAATESPPVAITQTPLFVTSLAGTQVVQAVAQPADLTYVANNVALPATSTMRASDNNCNVGMLIDENNMANKPNREWARPTEIVSVVVATHSSTGLA